MEGIKDFFLKDLPGRFAWRSHGKLHTFALINVIV